MKKTQVFYQLPTFMLLKPGHLAKSMYQARCFKVQRAFSEWKNSQWQAGRRDSEEELMNAILAINEFYHDDVNNEYRKFLAYYLHLLTAVTMDQSHYLLNDPGIVFTEFLVHEQSYHLFVKQDEDFAALAWLCVSVADTYKDEPNGDEKGIVDTLVYRMVERHLAVAQWPLSRDVVDALYGPSCWDLYSLDEINPVLSMAANAINEAGLLVLKKITPSPSIVSSALPNDLDVAESVQPFRSL